MHCRLALAAIPGRLQNLDFCGMTATLIKVSILRHIHFTCFILELVCITCSSTMHWLFVAKQIFEIGTVSLITFMGIVFNKRAVFAYIHLYGVHVCNPGSIHV